MATLNVPLAPGPEPAPRPVHQAPVLASPTLWPQQLLPRVRGAPGFPLGARGLRRFYLGRNAVWHAVHQLGLVGAEIIAPAWHHGVEIAALLDAGARVRFARVDERARLDLADVEAQLGPATRAVYVIHYAGFPQPVEALRRLCDARGLLLVEDCALSLFSRDGERPLGTHGDASIFCFYKTLPLSHGGALLLAGGRAGARLRPEPPPLRSTVLHTVSSLLVTLELRGGRFGATARRALRSLLADTRAWARRPDVPVGTQTFERGTVSLGMSGLSTRLALAADAGAIVRRRRAHWLALHRALGRTGAALWAELPAGVCPLFYALRVRDKDAALAHLRARGIQAVDFWRTGHETLERARFPEAEALRRSVVELPCHQDLTPAELDRVVAAALGALRA